MYKNLSNTLGELIKFKRKYLNLTITAAAEKAQISTAEWSKIESGLHWPHEKRLIKMLDALAIHPSEFFFDFSDSLLPPQKVLTPGE